MITFRRAIDEDLQAVQLMVIDLCIELGHDTDPKSICTSVAQYWSNPIVDCFIACNEGKPVGVAAFFTVPTMYNFNIRSSYEAFWYVKPEHRKGVGTGLLKYVENNLKTDIIDFGIENPRIQQLLRRQGYSTYKAIMRKVVSWV